jgi:dienelactone hydrolase
MPGISEDVFEIYKARFDDYDQNRESQVERVGVAGAGPVVVERVELADIDGDRGEILPAYVFFDSTQKAPYKPVIFFPGSGAIHMTNTEIMLKDRVEDWDYLLANGFAVVHPIYTSTYEKEDHLKSDYPVATRDYTEHVLSWGREYKKVIDYIVTRTDMDAEKLSYYGVSWGGYMANILLAIDDRVKAAVLNVAGLCFQPSEPSVESYIYTPRISCPIIMLNGKYDVFFPLETSQNPMFELIGTPEKDKKHYVYPSGHYVPRDRLIEEHLGWLQEHLEN